MSIRVESYFGEGFQVRELTMSVSRVFVGAIEFSIDTSKARCNSKHRMVVSGLKGITLLL